MAVKIPNPSGMAVARCLMRRQQLSGLVVAHLPNIRYLTGFSGSTGLALLTHRKCFLLLDSRYLEQASREGLAASIVPVTRDPWSGLGGLIRSERLRRVGFESAATSYQQARRLKEDLSGVRLVSTSGIVEAARRRKEKREIHAIGRALRLTEQAFIEVLPLIRPGMRETELAAELELRQRRAGAEAFSFETIVASGRRSSYPHGWATRRKLRAGDPIVIDFGIFLDGYASDFTRTVVLGKATRQFRAAYNSVRGALQEAENRLQSGRSAKWLDSVCRTFLHKAGLDRYFVHGTGHGVGLEIHEAPSISARSNDVIESGDLFTLEPGVYLPGQFGIRIEDMVWVNGNGCHRLNRVPHELVEL